MRGRRAGRSRVVSSPALYLLARRPIMLTSASLLMIFRVAVTCPPA